MIETGDIGEIKDYLNPHLGDGYITITMKMKITKRIVFGLVLLMLMATVFGHEEENYHEHEDSHVSPPEPFRNEGCFRHDKDAQVGHAIPIPVGYSPNISKEACYDYCKRHNEIPGGPKAAFFGLAIYEQVSTFGDEYAVCACFKSSLKMIPSTFCILDIGVHNALYTITGPDPHNTEQIFSFY
jgi:hypothetical protein